ALRARAADLLLVVFHGFAGRAESDVLRDVEAREIGLRSGSRDPRHLAVGKIGDAVDAAGAASAGDLRIEVDVGVAKKAKTEEQCGGQRDLSFGMAGKTQRPGVGGGKRGMILTDRSGL